MRDRFGEIFRGKIDRRAGGEMERGGLDRARTDRVVRTVIAARFVDRQKLHKFEPDLRRPIDELS